MPQMEGALAVSWVAGLPWGTTGERLAVDPRLGRSATSQPSLTACAPKLQGFSGKHPPWRLPSCRDEGPVRSETGDGCGQRRLKPTDPNECTSHVSNMPQFLPLRTINHTDAHALGRRTSQLSQI